MMQFHRDFPGRARLCGLGHKPQLIETRGTPSGVFLAQQVRSQWHVECAICGIATRPSLEASAAIRAWAGKPDLFHLPLSQLPAARVALALSAVKAA